MSHFQELLELIEEVKQRAQTVEQAALRVDRARGLHRVPQVSALPTDTDPATHPATDPVTDAATDPVAATGGGLRSVPRLKQQPSPQEIAADRTLVQQWVRDVRQVAALACDSPDVSSKELGAHLEVMAERFARKIGPP